MYLPFACPSSFSDVILLSIEDLGYKVSCFYSVFVPKLPSWACAVETKKPGLADHQDEFEFLLSSPVHSPEPYTLYPKKGLLLSGTGNISSPENRAKYITTRLEACSQVRTFDEPY